MRQVLLYTSCVAALGTGVLLRDPKICLGAVLVCLMTWAVKP